MKNNLIFISEHITLVITENEKIMNLVIRKVFYESIQSKARRKSQIKKN